MQTQGWDQERRGLALTKFLVALPERPSVQATDHWQWTMQTRKWPIGSALMDNKQSSLSPNPPAHKVNQLGHNTLLLTPPHPHSNERAAATFCFAKHAALYSKTRDDRWEGNGRASPSLKTVNWIIKKKGEGHRRRAAIRFGEWVYRCARSHTHKKEIAQ